MKNILLFIACLLINNVKAQHINWSDNYKLAMNTQLVKIQKQADKTYIVRRVPSPNARYVYLETFDNSLGFVGAKRLDLKEGKKVKTFEDVIFWGGKKYLFSSFHNKGKETHFLFSQEITNDFQLKPINLVAQMNAKKLATTGAFYITHSESKNKLLIVNEVGVKNKERKEFSLYIYDENMNLEWKKNVKLPYLDKKYTPQDFQIDNNGNIFMLGRVKNDKARKNAPDYNYHLLTYTSDGEEKNTYKINYKNKYLSNVKFKVNETDNTLLCVGYYSNQSEDNSRGIYITKIDLLNQSVIFETTDDYSSEVRMAEVRNRKRVSESSAELRDFVLHDVILHKNGSITLLSEQIRIRSVSDNMLGVYNPYPFAPTFRSNRYNQSVNNNFQYDYEDILISNISTIGEINWTQRIEKKQQSYNDGGIYSSFLSAVVQDNIFIFYNNNLRNFQPNNNSIRFGTTPVRSYYRNSDSGLVINRVTLAGDIDENVLEPNKRNQTVPSLKYSIQHKNDILFYGISGRFFKLGNFKLTSTEKM